MYNTLRGNMTSFLVTRKKLEKSLMAINGQEMVINGQVWPGRREEGGVIGGASKSPEQNHKCPNSK